MTEPEVVRWEQTAQQSLAVNNIIVLLGALTFGLQLCLVLFFVFRCWRLDGKMREALKHPKTISKGAAIPSLHTDIYKQASYQQQNKDPSWSQIVPVATAPHMNTTLLFTPPIPWDLVQG
ncbi:unnamed protein product [Tetraodon nigroviridis]|nr:unnamed protein product [Tetraodon nigroviridis]